MKRLELKPDEFYHQMMTPKPVVDDNGQQRVDPETGNPLVQICDMYTFQVMQTELLLNIRALALSTALKVGALPPPTTDNGLVIAKGMKS